jgi:transposase
MVVTVGIDVHKDTHCAVAVDAAGRQLGRDRTFRATDAGHRQLLRWALSEHGGEVVFAVEDCRHVSTRLERALLGAAQSVVRVPPKLMALTRVSARTRGKSDPIDALNIARAAVREPDLPRAEHTHASRTIKLLVDHREDLVRTRTAIQNRLRWLLHELDPSIDPKPRGLDSLAELDRVRGLVETLALTAHTATVVRIVLEQLEDIRRLTVRAKALEKELADLVAVQAPQLLTVPGCGVLTAAKIVGETANPARFRSEACYAMHAGVAPIPASSGRTQRNRLARGGNRQLNAAFHRIAVTQARLDCPGRDYYLRRKTEHQDSTMEALRVMKRKIARTVFTLLNNPTNSAAAPQPLAA